MTIELQVHLEMLPDGTPAWWGESDQLPGFAFQADSLRSLFPLAEAAARELAAERGIPVEGVAFHLCDTDDATDGERVEFHGDGMLASPTGGPSPSVVESQPTAREEELATV